MVRRTDSYTDREVREHFQRLVGMGCLLSGQPPQIHHCKGGSMLRLAGHHGVAMKNSDWLTIPLAEEYHEGRFGVERGVVTWEARFGSQVSMLCVVSRRLGYDVFARAGITLGLERIQREFA